MFWNFGSLLGICLIVQILRGIFLAFRYTPDTILAFNRINNIINEAWNGFLFRNIHANGASIFFFAYIFILAEEFILNHLYLNTHELLE